MRKWRREALLRVLQKALTTAARKKRSQLPDSALTSPTSSSTLVIKRKESMRMHRR